MIQRFGHSQSPTVYSASGFGLNLYTASAIENTREAMFTYIDNYVKHALEKVYLPLTGNTTALLIGEVIESDFKPIESMKTALLAGYTHEDEERHLLAFLHEFHATLEDEITEYKATYPRYLTSLQPQLYTNGKPLVSPETEKALLELLPEGTTLTYATGPIGEYFQTFIVKCYKRATAMLALSKQFDATGYEQFTIEEFRSMAKSVTGEIGRLEVENKSSIRTLRVHLNNRYIDLARGAEHVPLPYDNIDTVTLKHTNTTTEAEGLTVKNYGDKAFIAYIGTGVSRTYKIIDKCQVAADTGVITAGSNLFTGPEGYKGITFEELPLPVPQPQQSIPLEKHRTGIYYKGCQQSFHGQRH